MRRRDDGLDAALEHLGEVVGVDPGAGEVPRQLALQIVQQCPRNVVALGVQRSGHRVDATAVIQLVREVHPQRRAVERGRVGAIEAVQLVAVAAR